MVLFVVMLAWEVAEYAARGGRADHPTLSSMLDAVDRHEGLKAIVFFLWLYLGAAIVRRGETAVDAAGRAPGRRELRALLRGLGRPRAGHSRRRGARSRVPGSPRPAPAVVLERLATGPFLRVVLVLAWMWAGWHLFAR